MSFLNAGPAEVAGVSAGRITVSSYTRVMKALAFAVAAVALGWSAAACWARPAVGHSAPSGAIRILVLNGTHRPGLAAVVTDRLSTRGFTALQLPAPQVANAPYPSRVTVVYFDPARPRAETDARATRRTVLGPTRIAPLSERIRAMAALVRHPTLVLVIGTSFRGLR